MELRPLNSPGKLSRVRGPASSSSPNSPMSSLASDMNTPASSMGPGQPNMMGGPMRPGMSMGGMGGGQATIMSGPNTMVRSVAGGMVPGGVVAAVARRCGAGHRAHRGDMVSAVVNGKSLAPPIHRRRGQLQVLVF